MIRINSSALKHRFGDNVLLSLAGEVLLTPNGDTEAFKDMDRQALDAEVARMEEDFPFIRIGDASGLLDVSIKFFAHNARVADADFLPRFEEALRRLVAAADMEKAVVRLNIFGTFETLEKRTDFRYLNKKDDVRCAMTEKTEGDRYRKITRPKIYVPVLIVIGIIYAAVMTLY